MGADQPLGELPVGGVASDRGERLAELLADGVQLTLVPGDADHRGAAGDERRGDGAPEAPCGTGDHGGVRVGELVGVVSGHVGLPAVGRDVLPFLTRFGAENRRPGADFFCGILRVRKNRLRPKYKHGCGGDCGRKPGYCKQRLRKNEDTANTKSRAGRRVIGLPDELVRLLELHQQEQERDRRRAGQEWHDSGYVFTSPFGWPLVPSTDYDVWKRLLSDAGVCDGRLHDARHTAATVLLILGVPERVVMQIMGWSSTAMAARYQHVTGGILKDVAQRVGGLIWQVAKEADGGDSEAA